MRLIDADALKKEDFQDFSNTDVFIAIDSSPTIDALPVVKCKDCRYFEQVKTNCKGYMICPMSNMEISEYDYCSCGERKIIMESEQHIRLNQRNGAE